MADDPTDLLAIKCGSVTAPAGCGKTHLIAKTLTGHSEIKPILVLTHTNAGVVALRARLDRLGVPPKAYRLSTIDGWAMKLVGMFPTRAQCDPAILKLENPASDYPAAREAAARLLAAGHISDVLCASYARLIVDEHQDCSGRQHRLVKNAADQLDTCILGDPLQAIFGFGGDDLARWDEDVCQCFPVQHQLGTPWRWINAGEREFGEWLLSVREKMLKGEAFDVREAPPNVRWVELDGKNDHVKQLQAGRANPADRDGSVLIIGDSRNPSGQRDFAGQTPGAITVEAVDLRDFVAFARRFDLASSNALSQLATFAQSVMINVGAADLLRRVETLEASRARKSASDTEAAALRFRSTPTYGSALDLLVEIGKQGGVRQHRPAVLRACMKALQLCHATPDLDFADAAIRMREQNRLIGRPLPKRAVGSTLLLKGLEADTSVILDATNLDARNLYVAMTRGSRRLIICSKKSVLQPKLTDGR